MKIFNLNKVVFLSVVLMFTTLPELNAQISDSLTLYTPYTQISVSPGKTVTYSIDVINNSKKIIDEHITISGIPSSWHYTLTAGGYDIRKLATLPGQTKTVTLTVDIPFQVNKGNYRFFAKAGNMAELPLIINVSTGGSNETQFTCDQKNMEGTSKSTFSFKAVLKNQTATKQQYALMADPPRGWNVAIKPNYQQATSTELEPNSTKDITYDVNPPSIVEAGKYKIPVRAVSGTTSAELELEVVITGSYDMVLNTPSGLLSAQLTAGQEKKIEMFVQNTGSADLKNIELNAQKPVNWDVIFEPAKIENLQPGKTDKVYATIKADKKAIPGDYVIKVDSKTPEVSSSVSFRISVKTPILMGWLGILIIVAVVAVIYYLFKKFGRR